MQKGHTFLAMSLTQDYLQLSPTRTTVHYIAPQKTYLQVRKKQHHFASSLVRLQSLRIHACRYDSKGILSHWH